METLIVVYPNPDSYAEALLGDMRNERNVLFVKYPRNIIIRRILYYYTSSKANSLFRLPLQSLWYKTYTPKSTRDMSYVFLFFQGNALAYDRKYLEFLKKEYKNSALCFNWLNIASTVNKKYISFVNDSYDFIFTFDINDHLKYGWHLHDAFYSDISKWEYPKINESDIFFVGKAKDRLDLLHQIYDVFTNAGLTCDFNINGVEKHNQIKRDIKYNNLMSYNDVLCHCANTKIILEIVQNGQEGLTLRTCESISLGKKLLTNNSGILNSHFYGNNIFIFNEVKEIDPMFILNSHIDVEDTNCRKRLLDPSLLLQDITKTIFNEI